MPLSFRRPLVLAAVGALVALGSAVPAAAAPADPVAGPVLAGPPRVGTLDVPLSVLAADPSAVDDEAALSAAGVLAGGVGGLQVADDRVTVTVHVAGAVPDATVAALRAFATVESVSTDLGVVTARVPAARLADAGALPGVTAVSAAPAPAVGGLTAAALAEVVRPGVVLPAQAPATCRSNAVQADAPLGTAVAREAYGVDGTGVTVGVISDSFATSTSPLSSPAGDVAQGLLPGPGNPCGRSQPVEVLADSAGPPGTDEGRAMLQLVHGVAPGARLLFAAGGGTQFTMAQRVDDLVAAGATVIVDDISYADEPAYQAGPLEVAVARARAAGVSYATAGGNDNAIGAADTDSAGRLIGSWATTQYRPTSCPEVIAGLVAEGTTIDCLDFGTVAAPDATLGFLPARDETAIAVSFARPWFAPAEQDGVAILADGELLTGVDEPLTPGTATYFTGEDELTETTRYEIVVFRSHTGVAPEPVATTVQFFGGGNGPAALEHDESGDGVVVGPTTVGHSSSPSALSTGASPYLTPLVVEPFSSTGPRTVLLEPVSGRTPAAALPEPLVVTSPDVLAVDRTDVSVDIPGRGTTPLPFAGTSAAAPHAAAVIALGRQLAPSATPAELEAALEATAIPAPSPYAGVAPVNVTGAGLINAPAFLARLAPGPAPTTSTPPPPSTTTGTTGAPTSSVVEPVSMGTGPTSPPTATGPLARTGASPLGLLGAGVIALLAGSAAVVVARRRGAHAR